MMKKHLTQTFALALVSSLLSGAAAHAATISSGSVTFTLNEGAANGISEFDALFSAATTRANVLSQPAPGDVSFSEGGTVQYVDPIRPFGEAPLNDAGGTTPGAPGGSRTRQATTLDFDPGDILGSWSTSNDSFGFTGNSILGEQIALTLMQRWTGPFTGSLLYGDFALRYTGSKLMLTSNIDFLHAEWAEIGSPVINYAGDTLTISGDLLIGEGLFLLDSGAVIGTDFGDFSLTAQVVPEPSSALLLLAGFAGIAGFRRRSAVKA